MKVGCVEGVCELGGPRGLSSEGGGGRQLEFFGDLERGDHEEGGKNDFLGKGVKAVDEREN